MAPNVRLVYSSSSVLYHCNKKWNNWLKGLKQWTSYSSVQLKQTDLLWDRHSQEIGTGWPQTSHLHNPFWLHAFNTSLSSFWLCLVQNQTCIHHQSSKKMQMGIHSRMIDNCKLYKSRLCCVCLPIIQLVITRCIYVQNIYELLKEIQLFKLVLEKEQEWEIKLPTWAGSWKKEESSRKSSISALLTMPKPLTAWITINCEHSERDGNTRTPDLPFEKFVCRLGSNS